ncbi:hypothetical protein Pmar_PMAR007948 [Perkinsus marinus ATCC 50983]|uniref:Uncharacterized protein n=1 Tax=Perkinsus marinus (strain ATCC 50983 / TXsc) TaxID=423536 RepID=C5L4T6_PERM5|nr:hypothetical protein Pmar_PMAR007948 [Perkinsus marinus ATCC 50983]EER08277.1 hypothetical protein Pmar_PMAR007948 [Perkinsus marinus ATCC 50983]|eukprot:XP_002776461.1 hypothetical protein Pmar_PMAR007948 [Perkinsus marinus ATCC 50983]
MTLGLGLIGDDGRAVHLEGWLVLLYGVLLISCFLYCSMNWANRQTSPSVILPLQVASFATLQPIGTGVLQYLVTGRQVVTLPQVGMYLFVIIGVVLVSYGRPPCDEELLKSNGSEKEEVIASELESGMSTDDDDKLE